MSRAHVIMFVTASWDTNSYQITSRRSCVIMASMKGNPVRASFHADSLSLFFVFFWDLVRDCMMNHERDWIWSHVRLVFRFGRAILTSIRPLHPSHTNTHLHTHTTPRCPSTCVYVHTRTHTHTNPRMHARTHTHKYLFIQTLVNRVFQGS